MSKKVALVILDGWGKGDKSEGDATFKANVPFVNSLYNTYPNALLKASGEDVGLPDGQMGNSEVGHLNIGAGRVVYQDLVKINLACRSGELAENPELKAAMDFALKNHVSVHFMGLVSEGGVHSSLNHLKTLCTIAETSGLEKYFVHAFTDGRDTDPKSGLGYMEDLQNHLNKTHGKIASLIGRYYAMDRDNRWERVKLAYDMLVKGKGLPVSNIADGIRKSYEDNITDEFIKPMVVVNDEFDAIGLFMPGDVVICFNFRTDRCREITQVLTQEDNEEFKMETVPLYYVTMTNYDKSFKGIKVLFDKDNLHQTLGEVLAENGKTQLRIAETEKYPHVTFFFSGGQETTFKGEKRIMIPSPKVATYDLQPEMSAAEVKDAAINDIQENKPDFICLNFANPDMVGHTGDFQAEIKALETVDKCLKELVAVGLENDYSFIIIADHGNAEYMVNADGSPNTAHTTNPVPIFLIDKDFKTVANGKLADIAPTVLKLLGLNKPEEMSGVALV